MKTFLLRIIFFGSIGLIGLPIFVWAAPEETSNVSKPVIKKETLDKQNQLDQKMREQKSAVEEVNALIVDSYKTLLDKILDQLYINVAKASAGDKSVQIEALSQVRDNLDRQLDKLEGKMITPNRKKILQGIYFYLKSNVETKIKELQE